jgi:hypothetical protein
MGQPTGPSLRPTSPTRRVGRIGGGATAFGIDLIVVPFLNYYLQENFAKYRADAAKDFIEQALVKANPRLLAAISANRPTIEAAQAEGKLVSLHVVVELGITSGTDISGLSIGDMPYVANIKDVQIVVEGEQSRPYRPDTTLAGDLFRELIGVYFRYETYDYLIEGTDLEARRRYEQTLKTRREEMIRRAEEIARPLANIKIVPREEPIRTRRRR